MIIIKLLTSLCGTLLLFIGMVVPLVCFSVTSMDKIITASYFSLLHTEAISLGKNDGLFLLGVSILSLILICFQKYKFLYIFGIISLATLYSTYCTVKINLEKLAYINHTPQPDIHLQWGCILIVLGSLLLILCSYIGKNNKVNYPL